MSHSNIKHRVAHSLFAAGYAITSQSVYINTLLLGQKYYTDITNQRPVAESL